MLHGIKSYFKQERIESIIYFMGWNENCITFPYWAPRDPYCLFIVGSKNTVTYYCINLWWWQSNLDVSGYYISQVSTSPMVPHFLFMEIDGLMWPTLRTNKIASHPWQNKSSDSEYVDNFSPKQIEIQTNLGTLSKFRIKTT